jgi:hypothetical protein
MSGRRAGPAAGLNLQNRSSGSHRTDAAIVRGE